MSKTILPVLIFAVRQLVSHEEGWNFPATLFSLLNLAKGYAPAKIVTTAAKIGLLEPAIQPIIPEIFASCHHLSPKGIRYLLNTLVALGLFERREGAYHMKEEIYSLFEQFHDLQWDLIHHDHLYEVWGRLEKGIRLGHSPEPPEEELARYPESLGIFLKAMRAHARRMAPMLVKKLPWKGVRRLLDIGGGGGGFALSLVREIGGLEVTLLDLPDAIQITRDFVAREAKGGRIRCVPCNVYADPWPAGPFDRILVSHLLHIYPEEENRRLLQKVVDQLRPGGELLLIDYFLTEDETGPLEAVLFRLLMMVGTPAGDCFPLPSVKVWIREAGMDPIADDSLGGGNTLIRARKP